jgi:acetyl-CoA carboxylase biotin carboxyl carrier protein
LDLKEIKELIALMRRNDLSVFKLEQEDFKITLKRGNDFQPVFGGPAPVAVSAPSPAAPAAGATTAVPAAPAAPKESLREIKSIMVGTFYASPSPELPPFVSPGQEVRADETVVGIIEAMKILNEIKADISGTIVEVVAENGKPVEFGQVLFRVR